MRYYPALILIVAGYVLAGGARAGDIYCNNQGRDCSDRPSPGATEVHTAPARQSNNYEAPRPDSPPASAAPQGGPAAPSAADARLSLDASRQALQKDVATTRAEQCKQSKDKYDKSIEARRVYRMNKAGEREYLSDAEVEQARLNARLEMERACAKG